jgi:TonB-linked SusC/RagA family outer membrane protein
MQVSAAGLAQRINLSKSNAPLKDVLKELRLQSGYNFVYTDNLLAKSKPVDIKVNDADLEEVLKEIFAAQPLTYTIDSKTVVINAKDPTFLERLANRWASIDANGRVVDSENRPLPGASVKVKATGKGVSTDEKGRFFLRGVEEGAVLVVSFVGYLPKEVSASANMGSVVLEQSLSKLDEIQVIAYGTTTQRLSTGNVTTIKADVIEKQPVNNPLLALQGRVPGLFIEQATGFAGTGVKVRIQGQNSINNGNDPLYVIDGVPYSSQLLSYFPGNITGQSGGNSMGNPLNYINPGDIESIDVLKDADATSIYGSRAANGAILITTKKGKEGDIKVNFNIQSGVGQVSNRISLLNTKEYLDLRREALRNDGIFKPPVFAYDINGVWDPNRYTDWQKELIGGNAEYNDIHASLSGGSNLIQFLVGGTFHKETTVFPGNFDDKKASVHFNISGSSVNQKFKILLTGSYLLDNNFLPGRDLTVSAMQLPPNSPALFKEDGNINWETSVLGRSTFEINPMTYLYNVYNNKTSNLISNLLLNYDLLPNLSLKSSFSYNKLESNEKNLITSLSAKPEDIASGYNPRSAAYGNNNTNTWVVEPQLTYKKNIDIVKFEGLLGATFQQNKSDLLQFKGAGYNSDLVVDNINAATILAVTSNFRSDYRYNAFFGRFNFNIGDTYILNLNGRRDGSSRFGSENQFHNFGSIALAWIFSNQELVKDLFPFISYGKLKASYGTTGSDQIQDYSFLSLFTPTSTDIPYQANSGLIPSGLTNPYLQWEETRKLQIGVDLGFINNRILINTTYSRNRSSNQLLESNLPIFAGFTSILTNFPATVQNTGLELSLSSRNFESKDFMWSSNFNITFPHNKLVDFPNLSTSSSVYQLVIGQPITLIKQFHFLGVDPATGVNTFADRNGNPTINPIPSYLPNSDQTIIANPDPKFYGGFQNSFKYKSFELDLLIQFVKQKGTDPKLGVAVPGSFVNQPDAVLERWQKPGDISPIQRVNSNFSLLNSFGMAASSDATWSDASFVRLKNLSLSWTLPQSWVKSFRVQNCKLFLQGQNLWTLTKYSGIDPETKSYYSLPPLRVITAGIKVGL